MSKTHLDKKDIEQLMRLFDAIKLDLQGPSFPTRTNRLEAVENMAKVLEIHGWKAIRDPEIYIEPSKSQEEELKMLHLDEVKEIRTYRNRRSCKENEDAWLKLRDDAEDRQRIDRCSCIRLPESDSTRAIAFDSFESKDP